MRWPLPWPKSWREESPPEDEAPEEDEEEPQSLRQSAILFARDLAVAFLIVAIVMGLLYAYAQVWPPMVVVESDSMQHSGTTSYVGVIDTGDLVLVQSVHQPSDVTTYAEGRGTDYSTYSNFGDVIVFHAPGRSLDQTPIIHRAMAYVVPDPPGVDVPALYGHPNGSDWSGRLTGGQSATEPQHLVSLTLRGVHSWYAGQPSVQDITWNVANFFTPGFLTKGDHNGDGDPWGAAVGVDRIIGKARGELPWFGLIKLTLAPGASGCCPRGWGDSSAPRNSWDSLLVALILIIVGPFAVDFGWAYYADWRKKRRAATRAETAGQPGDPGPDDETSSDGPVPSAQAPDPEPEVTDEAQTGSAGPEGDGPEDL